MAYVVYCVESADRLELMTQQKDGQYAFKSIALSYINAPKLARRTPSGDFGDEDPCAYQAAELIRSTFIGKPVVFTEDYIIEPLNRSAGRLRLASAAGGSTSDDAASMLLKAGYAIVPDTIFPRMDKALYKRYCDYMEAAEKSKKGLFAPGAARNVRAMKNLPQAELAKLAQGVAGTDVMVRVEKCLSAVVLVISSESFGDTQFPVHMSGVSVKDLGVENLAQKAKIHTERFLLNRNVKMHFDGMDNFGNIVVSILSPKGSFQEELLSRGLVKVHGPTLSFCERVNEMKQAEETAQAARVGTWVNLPPPTDDDAAAGTDAGNADAGAVAAAVDHDGQPEPSVVAPPQAPVGIPTVKPDGTPGPSYMGPKTFSGTLVQVVHGDIVVVRDDASGQNIRLSLAGVRVSKNIVRDQDGNAPETRVTYNDYAWEAKEYIRSHFVGQKVDVVVEYARLMPETLEVRPAATVTLPATEGNIASAIIEQGYGHFFLGKNDVCSMAAELQAAEEAAKAAGKGVHSKEAAPQMKLVELSHLGEARGRYYLSFLQRGMQRGRPPVLRGVVDLVLGPSSLRVYVAKEHFQLPVKVGGVICPGGSFGGKEKADPFADEAKDFVVRLVQQRDVNIQVYASDRAGNYISSVSLLDGTNLAVAIVEAGFGTVANAEKLPFKQQLIDAETAARESKKHIWSEDGAIPQRAVKLEQDRAASNPHMLTRVVDESASFQPAVVTEVAEDGLSVYVQIYTPDMEKESGKIQALVNRTVENPEYIPKRGELVVAQYAADKTWCRAKVLSVKKGGEMVEVQYMDYGNVGVVKPKHIRAVPRGPEYAVVRDTPAFATQARLAFLQTSVPSETYMDAAVETIYEYTGGDVQVKAVYKDGSGATFYTVTSKDDIAYLSEQLLQRGYALLDKRTSTVDPKAFECHKAAQEMARKGHKGLWQYGDVGDDDEDD